MSGRKILILIHSSERALESVNFVAHLFKDLKVLMVIGFVEDAFAGTEAQRVAVANHLQHAYGAHPNIRLMVRNGGIFSLDDVVRESEYTDLIVMESALFRRTFAQSANGMHKAANGLKVPLIVVPEDAQKVEEVLFTFDGQRPSVNSIKQFCQIMGSLCANLRVTLLELNHDSAQFLPQEEKLLIEYLREHCGSLGIYKVSEESPDKILELVNGSKHSMVVAGAFNSLEKSVGKAPPLCNQLIEQKNLPGFFGAC